MFKRKGHKVLPKNRKDWFCYKMYFLAQNTFLGALCALYLGFLCIKININDTFSIKFLSLIYFIDTFDEV